MTLYIFYHVERSVSVIETSFEPLRQAQGDFKRNHLVLLLSGFSCR